MEYLLARTDRTVLVQRLEKASQLLAQASTAVKAKRVADMAKSAEVFAIKQRSEEAAGFAREIYADAMRLMGQFLNVEPKAKNRHRVAVSNGNRKNVSTLKERGISKKESVAAQAVAEVSKKNGGTFQDFRSGKISLRAVVREVRKSKQRESIRTAQRTPRPVDAGPFDLVLADPPWRYEHCEADNREIENQYPTATIHDICAHAPNSKPDSILFLWATAPKLEEALVVMKAWGFSYRSCAVWDKTRIGMGYWWRIQHELLLVGVKGTPGATPECERVGSIFVEKRGSHSAKPDCVYVWLERAFPSMTKLEMYCRKPRAGWAAHGNEI